MEKIILLIMTTFFILGGIDYLIGNKFGIGSKFKEGISSIGILVLSMTGILAIAPFIGEIISIIFVPIGKMLNIDPSIFPSMFLAIDMGALDISKELATNVNMYIINGVIISSTLGATLSFSIPLALGIIKKENYKDLNKGLIYGISTMPIAAIVAGIILKVEARELILNLIPLLILALIIVIGMLKFEEKLEKAFNLFSKAITILSVTALMLIGASSILGINEVFEIFPINESIAVAGKIGIFLAGAYPFLEVVTKYVGKYFVVISEKLGMNEHSLINLIASMISNIIVFQNFDKLDKKGRIICTAFSVSGAFVLGGQLGFVSTQISESTSVYIISKIVAGIAAIILACIMLRKDEIALKKKDKVEEEIKIETAL